MLKKLNINETIMVSLNQPLGTLLLTVDERADSPMDAASAFQ